MQNQIVCPNCKKTITHNATIDAAEKGQSSSLRAITCDCGERFTFWQITAQLRDQKRLARDSEIGSVPSLTTAVRAMSSFRAS